jgi:hypothetical protein
MIKFLSGACGITPGADRALAELGLTAIPFLARHLSGEWGDIDPEDIGINERALVHGDRIMSVYKITETLTIWIITEHDRSVTTILLPAEY